jgi:hypothetical protein
MDDTVACTFEAVCSVRPDRSWLPEAISWLAVAMLSLASRTCDHGAQPGLHVGQGAQQIGHLVLALGLDAARQIAPAIACAAWRATSSGRQIECMFSRVSGTTTITVITTAAANSSWVCLDTRA